MVIKLKMPINLFPNKKTYLTKAESQLVSQEFDAMFYSNLFIIFGTTEFQTPSRAKKKDRQSSWRNRGRQRGAIRFKHKNSGFAPILQCYGTKKFMELHSNTVKLQAMVWLLVVLTKVNIGKSRGGRFL